MLKRLFRLLIIVVIAIVAYNYFYGDASEQKQSKEIIQDVKDLGKSIKDLFVSEKGKFQEGKYDNLTEKIQDAYDYISENIGKLSKKDQEDLQKQSKSIEKELKQLKKDLEDNLDPETEDRLNLLLKKLNEIEKEIKEKIE